MKKIINRLKSDFTLESNYIRYDIVNFGCGDGYKNSLQHQFKGSKEDVQILTELIKKFGVTKIVSSTNTSFIFQSETLYAQVFTFRLCRYVRHDSLLNVLKHTLELNKNHKITIHNAFVIAVQYAKKVNNTLRFTYYSSRDMMVMNISVVNFSFPTLKDFKQALLKEYDISKHAYTEIFYYDSQNVKGKGKNTRTCDDVAKLGSKFKQALLDNNWKKAERIVKLRLY